MPRRMVEGREVVVVVLDLGALHDAVAEADEDVLDLPPRLGQQVEVAGCDRGDAGQGDVEGALDEAPLELVPLELLAASREQPLEVALRGVGGGPDRSPLIRRQLADPPEDSRQLGLAAQVAHPQVLERRGVRSGGDRRLGLATKCVDSLGDVRHDRPSYLRPRTGRSSRPSRR